MGLGYPPLTRSRLSPLGGAWEGSRCDAYAWTPPAGNQDRSWSTCKGACGAGSGGGCCCAIAGPRIAQRSAGLPETCAGATQRARVFHHGGLSTFWWPPPPRRARAAAPERSLTRAAV